jgi:hypothetical protein
VLYDNLKTAVVDRDAAGAVRWSPALLDLADYYGFAPQACRPYRAQTKGKVERSVAYVRGDFWAGLRCADLADLNRQARAWAEGVANRRVHGTTGAVPAERLAQEGLRPLAGKPDYDTALVAYRRSSRDCLVAYEGNYYSVPAHAGQQLLVRETEDEELVVLSAQGAEVARHRLAAGANRRVVVPAHYAALQRDPAAAARRSVGSPARPVPDGLGVPDAPPVEARPLAEYDRLLGVAL